MQLVALMKLTCDQRRSDFNLGVRRLFVVQPFQSTNWCVSRGHPWCVPGAALRRSLPIDTVGLDAVIGGLDEAVFAIGDCGVSVRVRGD
jgi:hypothetical protein